MKISIITINYNNKFGLQNTIKSVINQTFNHLEYIVIDGGSDDGSIDIVKNYDSKITYWISEKDRGIYDAMNKGIKVATGEYLLFLNSGDILSNNSVVSEFAALNTKESIVYGNQYLEGHFLKKYPKVLTLAFFLNDTLPHQSTFIKKTAFQIVGLYSNKHEIANDYLFFLEAIFKYNLSYRYCDITISNFDMTGLSNQKVEDVLKEFKLIQNEVFKNSIFEISHLIKAKNELEQIKESKFYRFLYHIKTIKKIKLFK